MSNLLSRRRGIGIAFLSLLFAYSGCTPTPAQVSPKLPPGFLEENVPVSDLSAYLYVSQEPPFRISTNRFGDLESANAIPIPASIDLNQLALMLGPSQDSFAATIELNDGDQAEAVKELLLSKLERDVWREGRKLYLTQGSGDWVSSLKSALQTGATASLEEAYPETWELMQFMPASPPSEPIAAGFVKVQGGVLTDLMDKAGLELEGLAQALGTIRVDNLAYNVYSESPLIVDDSIGPEFARSHNISIMVVMKSAYPGFLLSFFLNNFSDKIGLEKGSQVVSQDVFAKEMQDSYLIVKSIGSTLFLSLATDKSKAESLMTSVLGQQKE